ncbi:hypothetical protein [Bradyrhizobium sp. USDA 3364]
MNKGRTRAGKPAYSPSAFLRARRPEQFSDSREADASPLDRSLFEYQLETLTSRSDEKPFEIFCRRLAQKEICPNLIPQTGPTGGGDSKVDTETYPVASEVADRWYEANPNAGSERWAFAVSAKKDWRTKVRSDVKKIAETKRGYSLIYFLSNQFIKDRDRADTEDELTRSFGIAVRILDRGWIVERVFDRKHFKLAIDSLNISVSSPKERVTGPRDAQKRADLDELERKIADQDRYSGDEYQLAEDCLDVAILGRELELSRTEVEGLFDRANRIALKVGSSQQLLRIRYQRAWTACFWFDDFETVNELYNGIEELALESEQADDLEWLSNAWNNLLTGVRVGALEAGAAKLQERTERLQSRLVELSEQPDRPNNAALARTVWCTTRLAVEGGNAGAVSEVLTELAKIFREAEYMGGYPFDRVSRLFEEFGQAFGSNPAYDEAFETLLPILERRRSEAAAGLALLTRGRQKLEADDNYDAIRLLGRAQTKLIKYEHRRDLVHCLMICALAYQKIGLLWAAHSIFLAAASHALSEFVRDGHIGLAALRAIQQLVWIELQLGRLPHVLNYVNFERMLADFFQLDDDQEEAFTGQFQAQDRLLAALLLRSSMPQLAAMDRLPKTLEKMGLFGSAMVLLYLLGHRETLLAEGYVNEEVSEAELNETIGHLSQMPDNEHLPSKVELFDGAIVLLWSSVLGCQWTVTVDSTETGIRIGEAFLGFIEMFFATSLDYDAIPHRQRIDIRIAAKEIGDGPEFQIAVDDPEFLARIDYSTKYDSSRELVERKLRDFLRDTLAVLIPRILYVPDLEKYFERIAMTEEGFGRSLAFADVFTSASNVVGATPFYDLSSWLDEQHRFALKRTLMPAFEPETELAVEPGEIGYGEGEPPPELRRTDRLKHGQRRVLSVIDMALWEAAKWRGMAVSLHQDFPPGLMLLFENEKPARQIFETWRKEFGRKDEQGILRISLVTGVDRHKLSSYSIVVSTNVENVMKDPQPFEQAVVVSRAKRMDPADPRVLEMFLAAYRTYHCYFVAPAILSGEGRSPEVIRDLPLFKDDLSVREAWRIGAHDPDFIALYPDDDPVIPEGVTDPPVRRALERHRQRAQR